MRSDENCQCVSLLVYVRVYLYRLSCCETGLVPLLKLAASVCCLTCNGASSVDVERREGDGGRATKSGYLFLSLSLSFTLQTNVNIGVKGGEDGTLTPGDGLFGGGVTSI